MNQALPKGSVEMKSRLVADESGNYHESGVVIEQAQLRLDPNAFQSARSQSQDHSLSLRENFSRFHLSAPLVAPEAPRAVSSMGVPITSAIHRAAQHEFKHIGKGWDGNTSDPDDFPAREARINHVLESALRNSKGLDLMAQTSGLDQQPISPVACLPDIQAFIDSEEKIVAILNCAEVHGAPDSKSVYSKGFVQAAIIEHVESQTRRLIIFSLSGNVSCTLNEQMDQSFYNATTTSTECCCFESQRGQDRRGGLAAFHYTIVSQSQSEITMLNIQQAVVRVQVTKNKLDSFDALANPPVAAPQMFSFVEKTCWEECTDCCKMCCCCCQEKKKKGAPKQDCISLLCKLFQCCSCPCSYEETRVDSGERHVRYHNVIGRDLGYTSMLNAQGQKSVYARDVENGEVTAVDIGGSAQIVTRKTDMNGVPWKVEEIREERVVIEITYRSVLSGELQTCHLVMNKAMDTSRAEFQGELSHHAQSDTVTLALAGKFANKLLPFKSDGPQKGPTKKNQK
jgi:hypothetical protein